MDLLLRGFMLQCAGMFVSYAAGPTVFVGRDCCQRTTTTPATAANFLCTFNYRARVIDATFECVAFC